MTKYQTALSGSPLKQKKNVLNEKRRDSHFLVTKQDGSLSSSLQTKQRIIAKGNKIHVRVESPTGVASKNLVRSHNIQRLRDKYISAKVVSNLTISKDKTKLIASNSRKTEKRKKKTLFKKYALLQSLPLLQTQPEPQQTVLTGGDESNAGYALQVQGDQTGDAAAVQEQSPDDQQQQSLSDGNSLGQYALSQDSTSYQQDSSQPSIANLADSNIEDAAQSEDGQPSSLEQAVQLQQAGYTQHSQEQEQDQDAPLPISQGGELAGQENQVVSNAQLQYQNQQAGQEQEQPMQEQEEQDQAPGQSNYEQAGFQQEQPQQLDQQESREMDQQPQDQIQDYQQQQDEGQKEQEQQQIVEEPQETQGAPSETQSPSSSSNSYGTLFSTESQSPGSEQQSQGTLSYSNDQNNDNGEKVARPSVQYAASIEEALKEPGVSSQESNSEGGDAQGGVDENEGANVLNVRPETDSKGSEENGFVGTGSISAPTGYQTSVVDDNGNPIQTSPNQEVNGYASPYEQQRIGDTNALEGNQPPQSTSLLETQNEQNFAEQQPQHQSSGPNRPKVSPVEDDVLKIISIDNKNAPNAVNGCKGCPPHARCINKVCIINDDQPLAHILSALSGPEPDEASEANECKECHYNAKCINKECVCKAGYTGDGIDCRPDTCLPGCKEHGKCIKGFCLCDHHHYFNGYECSPYKITHRNCPIQCTTSCHAKCPANCCKQHPVIKTHYSEDNPQQIGEAVSVNGLLSKGKNGPNPPEVVLKPFVKVGQPIANFAPDFQSRPHDSGDSDLEAVHVKHPLGSFTMTETDANPLFGEDDCPDKCNNECLDICPVKCCLKGVH
ncbi:probable serine/threonine-protein kinase fhkB [Montipora capricornis]|uniref:probable serine/threonine-protein kinase fhkB n=1 Tax=Montipora capricornis TaxID=246305 RepID=UPI0035F1D227